MGDDLEDEDEEEAPPEIFKMKKAERTAYLEQTFLAYDVDKSGEIDSTELLAALKKLGVKTNRRICETMLKEMDQDRSGAIDMEEFKEFFNRVEKFETLKSVMNKTGAKSVIKGKVMGCYLMFVFVATFIVVIAFLDAAQQPGGASRELQTGFAIVVIACLASVFCVLCWPLIELKWQSWVAIRGDHLRKALDEARAMRAAAVAAAAARKAELANEDPVKLETTVEVQLGSYRRAKNDSWQLQLPGEVDMGSTTMSRGSKQPRGRRRQEEDKESEDSDIQPYDPDQYDPLRAPTELPWNHSTAVMTFSPFSQNRMAPY